MVRKLSGESRFQGRGLPESYDPHYFYEYRIMKRSSEATGIEGFLYQIMPWNLIRSFAFAIDPFGKFKTASGRISPVTRTRTGTTLSVFDTDRKIINEWVTQIHSASTPADGPCEFGAVKDEKPFVDHWESKKTGQTPFPRISKDTTIRTRPFGYTMGEFQKTVPAIYSGPRAIYAFDNNTLRFTGFKNCPPNFWQSIRTKDHSVGPSAATYRIDHYTSVKNNEFSILETVMASKALAMYKGINPVHRNYSLFRNIVELRDLPGSILSLREAIRNFSSLERLLDQDLLKTLRETPRLSDKFIKTISGEYLSYHFGWKQLYNDIYDLLVKPKSISDQVDFLIRRAGKPTTYRSRRTFVSGMVGVPAFSYDYLSGEVLKDTSTHLTRTIELKMVVNTTFEFPGVNTPKFRSDLFNRKLGVNPTFTDLYNLVPWTWLVDWFTGLGNYVEVIDEINRDPSLINWGFITGISSVDLQTDIVLQRISYEGSSIDNVGHSDEIKQTSNHASILHMDLQLRKSLASVFDVNQISDPGSLTPYQNSILGALLAQRTHFSR